jgi:hypothetical protein
MFDEEFGMPLGKVLIAICVWVAITVIIVGVVLGYKIVRLEPQINWVPQPFLQEKNQQGQPVDNVYIGLDDKGYWRGMKQAIPPPPPQPPTAPEKHGK